MAGTNCERARRRKQLVARFLARRSRGVRRAGAALSAADLLARLRYVGNDADAKDVAQRALVQAFVKVRAAARGGIVSRLGLPCGGQPGAQRRPRSQAGRAARRGAGRRAGSRAAPRGRDRSGACAARWRSCRRSSGSSSSCGCSRSCRFAAVAEVAECSEDAAKVNFHYALKKLRVLMNEENEP